MSRLSPATGALERCVGDPQRFLSEVWGRRAAHHSWRRETGAGAEAMGAEAMGAEPGSAGTDEGFADLLSLEDVDHLLSSTALRIPMFRLVKAGTPLPTPGYTKSGRISGVPMTGIADPPRIYRAFEEGATIVLQGAHRYWAPLARFCRGLESALGHTCQANAYITPPGSRGLGVHHDSHDVFVLQAFGRKQWEVHAAPAEGPDRPPLEIELAPGDALYMPRGTPHAARTQEILSGHLTIGILATTWRRVFESVTHRLLDDAALDESLPPGFHREPQRFEALVSARLDELSRRVEKVEPADVAERTIDRFYSNRPSLVEGGLVDLTRLEHLGENSLVRRRDGSICELRSREGALLVLLGDRTLRMPAWLEPAMRDVSAREEFRVRELVGVGDLESRLVLVRRLVREGLLEVSVAD